MCVCLHKVNHWDTCLLWIEATCPCTRALVSNVNLSASFSSCSWVSHALHSKEFCFASTFLFTNVLRFINLTTAPHPRFKPETRKRFTVSFLKIIKTPNLLHYSTPFSFSLTTFTCTSQSFRKRQCSYPAVYMVTENEYSTHMPVYMQLYKRSVNRCRVSERTVHVLKKAPKIWITVSHTP